MVKPRERNNKGQFIRRIHLPEGIICPRCGSYDIISATIQWKCKKCGRRWLKVKKNVDGRDNNGRFMSQICPHGISPTSNCGLCKNRYKREWIQNRPEVKNVYNHIRKYPELYPLDDECIFCNVTENLEHGHLDYEDNGFNYVTTCHQCNLWMGK